MWQYQWVFTHMSSFLTLNSFVQMMNFNTRGDNILNIFASTKPNLYMHPLKMCPLGKSDHCDVAIKPISRCLIRSSVTKIIIRDYCPKNQARFLSSLVNINWPSLLSFDFIDLCIFNFNNVILNLV